MSLITLLTDFGNADYFVAAMKGVILTANPAARIVDITHDIPPQDIEAAAFTLLAAYSSFPSETIHVAVVDPGVGSARRPIVMKLAEQFFVGPDNGIFSYVREDHENRGLTAELFYLTNEKYFRQPVSATFHGRDVFAPVAAALSRGVKLTELATKTTDFVRLAPLLPTTAEDGKLIARIIHVDRFGNCVTNLTQNDLTAEMIAAGATLRVNGKSVKSFRNHFAEAVAGKQKLFAIWGSAGFLEIVATNESAVKLLKAKRGDVVIVTYTRTSSR
ncbi:MAG TPA: SAM-dependent chlorinase/fluorinase [Pyrinomonadaceae bacterium]|nr:SAM-dependent chlorinase/fluorinase [Pyrinomonadaceae bacterium]